MIRARINATGEVVDVRPYQHELFDFMVCRNEGMMGELYTRDELTIIGDNELEFIDEPQDYWTRLEHQYAGMALQGMLANANHYLWERKQNYKSLVANAAEVAHALVEKYKEEE